MSAQSSCPSGWLILYKPKGLGSTQAVGRARRLMGVKKIGHAGTLDPLAEGVLPLAIGQATKTIPFAMDARKEYVFTIAFGSATTTEDAEGEVCQTSGVIPTHAQIEAILPQFIGEIEQIPPRYSAIKIDGKRAYDLARAGKKVEMKSRRVTIDSLALECMEDAVHARLRVQCSKGTYVRSLARDIAQSLGSCGHISYLQRSRVGKFCLEDTISLEKLEEICDSANRFGVIRPIDAVLDDILVLQIDEDQARAIRFGQRITISTHSFEEEVKAALYCNDRLVAFAHVGQNKEAKPLRVFNDS